MVRHSPQVANTTGDSTRRGDGAVDALDFVAISNNYGSHAPEPATLALLAMGGAWLAADTERKELV